MHRQPAAARIGAPVGHMRQPVLIWALLLPSGSEAEGSSQSKIDAPRRAAMITSVSPCRMRRNCNQPFPSKHMMLGRYRSLYSLESSRREELKYGRPKRDNNLVRSSGRRCAFRRPLTVATESRRREMSQAEVRISLATAQVKLPQAYGSRGYRFGRARSK